MQNEDNRSKDQLAKEVADLQRRVSELEASEASLKQAEERYRSIVTVMVEGVVLHQYSGEIIACNAAAEQILGLPQDQMMGRTSIDPHWRAIHEDGSPFPGETHPAMITLRTGQPQRNVIMGVYKPDGRLSWISINSQPLFQPGESKPYGVVATFSDITEQRQAEELLRESEARFHNMFANHAAVMLLIEPMTGQIIDANLAAEKFYSYSVSHLCAMNIAEINMLPPEQIGVERQNALHRQDNYFVFPHRLANGEIHTVEVHSSPIILDNQPILFSIIHDITERKQAEKALLESEERLEVTIKGASLGTWDWRVPSGEVIFNERWAEMLGYSLAEIEPHIHSWGKVDPPG